MSAPNRVASVANMVTLSLISHTNAGKTTLARTLLRRDVGEVQDAPHVTLFNESHTLIETSEETLRLWDTPGFGDSTRLLKRLQREKNPVLWFLSQAWDRFTDRPLWCSQQALKNVRDDADIVLYLVNAGEPPEVAGYIPAEMEILSWVGKPVLVLLNQTGPPHSPTIEQAEVELWTEHFRPYDFVKGVISLDAFARCWVQEDRFMEALEALVEPAKKLAFETLRMAWHQRNVQTFEGAMKLLAEQLTAAVLDGADVRDETLMERVGIRRAEINREYNEARQKLAVQMAERAEHATNALIRLHDLEGLASRTEGRFSAEQFHTPEKVSESVWSILGSFAGGAMGGLIADLKSGGMTFGGGALIGGIGAGLGAYALIRSYNLVRGSDERLHWSCEHFREQTRLAMLCYLAVAHFGRGRGSWQESEQPQHWRVVVDEILERYADELDRAWTSGVKKKAMPDVVFRSVSTVVMKCGRAVLDRLYPSA